MSVETSTMIMGDMEDLSTTFTMSNTVSEPNTSLTVCSLFSETGAGLTQDEQVALSRMRRYCLGKGYCISLEDGELTVDDITLLRFLRAHNFDIEKTIHRFHAVQEWRRTHDMERAYRYMDVEIFEDYRAMFAQWTGRCDRQGLPLYVFPMKHFTPERMDAYISKHSQTFQSHFPAHDLPCHVAAFHALYEHMLKFVMPLCTQLVHPKAKTPVSASTHIIDITGVGFGQFWKIKKYLQSAIVAATTHYPDTLGHIFVVGAPPSFIKVWGIIRKWFDPGSVAKVLILPSSEVERTLADYIEPENLPRQYGGKHSWEWGDMPDLGEMSNDVSYDVYKRDETGVRRFIRGPVTFSSGRAHVWGNANGKPRWKQ